MKDRLGKPSDNSGVHATADIKTIISSLPINGLRPELEESKTKKKLLKYKMTT